MIYTSAKAQNEAIEILRGYSGTNPYYLMLKRDVIIKGDVKKLNAFNVEYIIENQNFVPKQIGKTIKIADWYGLKKQEDWVSVFWVKQARLITVMSNIDKVLTPLWRFYPKRLF